MISSNPHLCGIFIYRDVSRARVRALYSAAAQAMSPLSVQLKVRLLGSIEAHRLVVLSGAGLSMAEPSRLPSAQNVAQRCFDRYRDINPGAPAALRDSLEALANHFFDASMLDIFIASVVPWGDLVAEPNKGHEAIADFLLTGAADHVISANFDVLIERATWERLGGNIAACLDGDEAVRRGVTDRPLLKVHGCSHIDRWHTIWTPRQLTTEPVRTRIERTREWLTLNLRHKDLIVLGFWSDWAYLNSVLERCLTAAAPARVTVVDLASSEQLQEKAPALWQILHRNGVQFEHVQASAAEFLDDLREGFSRSYLRRLMRMGAAAYEGKFGEPCPEAWLNADDVQREHLYALRRDAECRPIGRPAYCAEPRPECQNLALFLLALRRAGGMREGALYRFQGRLIRVLNGTGRWLREIQALYSGESLALMQPEVVACIGALDYGAPGNIVRGGASPTLVRPAVRGEWLDGPASHALVGL